MRVLKEVELKSVSGGRINKFAIIPTLITDGATTYGVTDPNWKKDPQYKGFHTVKPTFASSHKY